MNKKVIISIIVAVFLALVAAWAINPDVDGDVELPTITADMDVEEGSLPNVEITGNLEMPTVDADVNAEGGNLPEVDVNVVDVELGTEEMEVEVPTDVNVETETKTIEVPTLDIDAPEEDTIADDTSIDADAETTNEN